VIAYTTMQLLHVMPKAEGVIAAWIGPLEQAMLAFGIDNRQRVSMFLANFAHESCELTKLEEDFHYKPDRLLQVFPKRIKDLTEADVLCARGPEAIANRVYANRLGNGPEESGDGWLYRGRGIGLTFRANYGACSSAIMRDNSVLIDNPEFVADPEFGAAAAAWFWATNDCNDLADAGDFDGVCDKINLGRKTIHVGDSNGYADRLQYLERCHKYLMD
jgi:putative chitinase